jgi:hypothetical protein
VAGWLTVKPDSLAAGSQDVTDLQGRCLAIAEDAVASMAAMADSAGHPDLASALTGAAHQGSGMFAGMWSAYGHASTSLWNSAATYAGADDAVARAARGIGL